MARDVNSDGLGRPDSVGPEAQSADENGELESYEVDGGVVFFDPMNPLAWVETSWTVRLSEQI
jgi:hypothetical protein